MFSANFPGKCVTLHCRKENARTFETSTFVIFYLINQLYCPKKLCYYPKKPCSTNPLPNCNLTADLYLPRLEMTPYRPTTWNPIRPLPPPLASWNVCSNAFVPSSGRQSAAPPRTRTPRPRKCPTQKLQKRRRPRKWPPTASSSSGRPVERLDKRANRIFSAETIHPEKTPPQPPGRQGASPQRREHRQGQEVEN